MFSVKRPIARNKDNYENGDIPFVASGSANNGVMKCCKPHKNEGLDKAGCITVSPVDGSAFYQPCDFLGRGGAGSSILMLYANNINLYSGQFIAKMISNTCACKYTYGHMGNKDSIKRERIMLPVDDNDEPDYQFMEDYMKALMAAKRKQYHEFISQHLDKLGINIDNNTLGGDKLNLYNKILEANKMKFNDRAWKDIYITSIFDSFVPGKGKGLNHLNQSQKDLSYIGATNRNNGVICFVESDGISCKMLQKGNCIGFIKNGDGSAGYAIYKRESFVSTSDVIYGYANWLNEYTGLFFVSAQDLIKGKYSHGYKRNQQHLRGDRVMLPVNDNDEPDYDFMEECGRKMMAKKYIQYLKYLEST